MRIIKPKALKQGDVIGITAPASPPTSEDALSRGIRYLEQLGYRIEVGSNIFKKRGYLAGTDKERAADLHSLFANKHVKAIFLARGGYGCGRLLPLLDYKLIRNNPKVILGYSDFTALSLAIFSQTGLVTFTGPMVASDMAEGLQRDTEERLWQTLTSTKSMTSLKVLRKNRIKINDGKSSGRLFGGNLSLTVSLLGTQYFPNEKNYIWLLEDIDERPYRIDRMLHQLKNAGVLKRTRGIVLGEFVDCIPQPNKPTLTLREVFNDAFARSLFPVLGYIHYGHIKNPMTLPIGTRVSLDTTKGEFSFLEGAVTH
jgi:muramoyltetrapeptide carboxypeptidase